jgi:uncharacterized protein
MQQLRYCSAGLIAVLFLASGSGPAGAQQAPAGPEPGEATYIVFMSGREVGREQVSVAKTSAGWRISSTGTLAPPLNLANHGFEITYAPDWQPIELKIKAQVQDRALGLTTSFTTTTAINEITRNGSTSSKTDQISARAVVLPNNFFAAYEALAVRLAASAVGATIPIYVAPQAEIPLTVKSVEPTTWQTPAGTVTAQRYSVVLQNPGGPVAAEITVDSRRRIARVDLGGGVLSIARDDLAGVSTRQQTVRNPTDLDVRIPAAGFNLAGTITTPAAQGRLRHPAIVLVGGSGQIDRDSTVAGIPIFAQLGHVVLRYDKRGVGQSGGRTETVTLQDYADDAIAAVRFLERRKDVDRRRIFVVGHSEGAAVAMLTGREKRIAGLVLVAGMGTTGRELILEQQKDLLAAAQVAEPERSDKIELQERILEAAVEDTGWDELPEGVRTLVDTPHYRSLLLFDPAQVMPRVRQPVLILHGERDRQVPPHHAGKVAELARARRNAPAVEMTQLPGLNHLLVPAATGDVSEYATLETREISPLVARSIAEWTATVAR